MTVNAWLCPVKVRGWNIIKRKDIFGAPRHASKTMEQVRIGDRLVFYLLRTTVKGVIAVYKVVSDVYEDNSDIWGKDRYPLRVRIEPIYNFENSGKRLVPLGFVYGGDSTSGIIVEPFLKNIWISKMEKHQYERLGRLFEGDK